LSSEREEFTGIERMGAFCDGVFAIALTLLVLELRVPAADIVGREGLWHALGGHWSSYGAFALSFGIIGIMWANHHSLFRYIGRTNHIFSMLNLGLLFFTVLLPFPTAVLATYLPSPEARTPATVLYGANLVMTAIFFNLLWRYAIKGRRLLRPEADQQLVDAVTAEYRLGPVFYGAATLLAFVSVWVSLGIHGLLAAMFLLPNKSRP
jgi:uncharacterized membrane protein